MNCVSVFGYHEWQRTHIPDYWECRNCGMMRINKEKPEDA